MRYFSGCQKPHHNLATVANSVSNCQTQIGSARCHRVTMSSPCLSPPSEGEIVESDSEKATTANVSKRDNSVDGSFRTRVSVSRSPSPFRSPVRHEARTTSRSPYREVWGTKRLVDDDHYDRSRNDPRRFHIRYEDRPQSTRFKAHKPYHDSKRTDVHKRGFRHEGQEKTRRLPDKQPTVRSRSPMHGRNRREGAYKYHVGGERDRHQRDQSERACGGSHSRLSREQSVSDRGHSPVAAAQVKREAETRTNQIQRVGTSAERQSESPAKCVSSSLGLQCADSKNVSNVEVDGSIVDRVMQTTSSQLADEATLIESRRKRREVIKARHRGQAIPFVVQALTLDNTSAPSTPKSSVMPEDNPAQGKFCCFRLNALANTA